MRRLHFIYGAFRTWNGRFNQQSISSKWSTSLPAYQTVLKLEGRQKILINSRGCLSASVSNALSLTALHLPDKSTQRWSWNFFFFFFFRKSIYYWIARLEGGSAVITDMYRDERWLLCVEADREENLEMFQGRDEREDNPLKSTRRLQAAMFKKLSSTAVISRHIFPLEIRPLLSPIKKERLGESRCS